MTAVLEALLCALAGFCFGRVYFALLRQSCELFAEPARRFRPLALTLARIPAAALFLGLVARLGAQPLLAAFLGFLLARALALHAARGTA